MFDFTPQHPGLAQENLCDVMRLIRTLNVGPVTFFDLIRRFGTAKAALDALPELSVRGGRRNPLAASPRENAMREIDAATKFGARHILYGAPDYPALLHAISDPPPVITVTGNPALWQKDVVALVGARNASAAGCQLAQKLARELGEAGLSVVSGLARGIDSFVHKGALASGTIGVIAGGIDNVYPPENAMLYTQMRESGAIISEQPFGALPYSGAFPGRNRIIAGMSLGTLVVEASPKSGSLITARFALENGREVLAVPGSPLDPRSKGCNHLLRQGATLVETAGDVLQALASLRGRVLRERPAAPYASTPAQLDESQVDGARRRLTGKLGPTAVSVDELIEQCDISAAAAMTILLELELAGRLGRSPGGKVFLIASAEDIAS